MTSHVPPHDLGAEQTVLGAMLLDWAEARAMVERLSGDDFYRPAHATIFAALAAAVEEREPTDQIAIARRLADTGELNRVGGAPALHDLAAGVPVAAQAGYYADIVARLAGLRRLADAGTRIVQLAHEEGRDPGDAAAIAAKMLADATASRADGALAPLGSFLDDELRGIEAAGKLGNVPGLSTGVEELDSMTGGLRGGQLVVVAGRPGMGKTIFGMHVARLAALKAHQPTAFFSLEMSKTELVARLLAPETKVALSRLNRGQLRASDWAEVAAVAPTMADAPLYVDDSAPITLADITARSRRLATQVPLRLVVVDYLQLVKPAAGAHRAQNREQEVAEISRGLKLLAKELDVTVVLAAQLNRETEKRTDRRPHLSDLRESGAIEQDADLVVFPYREDYYDPETPKGRELELILAKQRQGPTGFAIAVHDFAHANIIDPGLGPTR